MILLNFLMCFVCLANCVNCLFIIFFSMRFFFFSFICQGIFWYRSALCSKLSVVVEMFHVRAVQ